jgi:hypothetical protein
MTQQEIASFVQQTEEVCSKATKGPWEVEYIGRYSDHDEACIALSDDTIELSRYENADFVSVARTALPIALEIIRQLMAEDNSALSQIVLDLRYELADLTDELAAKESSIKQQAERIAELEKEKEV